MARYEVQVMVQTWAYVEIEADSEQEALKEAEALPYSEWKHDTDWSSADCPEVQLLEAGSYA